MAVGLEHSSAHVTGDRHDRLVRGLRLGQLGNGRVPKVMESEPRQRALEVVNVCLAFLVTALIGGRLYPSAFRALHSTGYGAPNCAPTFGGFARVKISSLAPREDVMLRLVAGESITPSVNAVLAARFNGIGRPCLRL